MSKTNGKRNVKIEKITDRRKKCQKRTEVSLSAHFRPDPSGSPLQPIKAIKSHHRNLHYKFD